MFYVVSPHRICNFPSNHVAREIADVEAEGQRAWSLVLDHEGNRLSTHTPRSVNNHKKPSLGKRILRKFGF